MSEQSPVLPQDLQQYDHLRAMVTANGQNRVYGVDEAGKNHALKQDDVAKAYGHEIGQPKHGNDGTPATPTNSLTDNYKKLGEAMNAAGDKVSEKRMLNAYMAADDYAEGHDRLADNPHISHLDGADKKLFALSSSEKQTHADRVTRTGAYDERLKSIVTDVKGKVDDEITERKNDSLAFWAGDEASETPDPVDPTPEQPAVDEPEEPEAPAPEVLTPEDLQLLENLNEAQERVDVARTNLARIRAERESRTLTARFSKKKFEAALAEYESALSDLAGYTVADLQRQGMTDPADLTRRMNIGATCEAVDLIHDQRAIELEMTNDKLLSRFYSWWAENSQKFMSVGTVKKAGVMLVPGVPIGLVGGMLAAPLGAAVAGGAAGAFLAQRISRGLMGAKISREANSPKLATQKADRRAAEVLRRIDTATAAGDAIHPSQVSDEYRAQTKEAVGRNRRAMAKAAGTAAVIGGGVGLLADHFGPEIHLPWGDNDEPNGGGDENIPGKPETEVNYEYLKRVQANEDFLTQNPVQARSLGYEGTYPVDINSPAFHEWLEKSSDFAEQIEAAKTN